MRRLSPSALGSKLFLTRGPPQKQSRLCNLGAQGCGRLLGHEREWNGQELAAMLITVAGVAKGTLEYQGAQPQVSGSGARLK
jgi:hypothetical protein